MGMIVLQGSRVKVRDQLVISENGDRQRAQLKLKTAPLIYKMTR